MLKIYKQEEKNANEQGNGNASVVLASIFQDNMVIQRGRRIPIRGTAAPRARLRIEFNGHRAYAIAGVDGHFSLYMPEMEAAENLVMRVFANEQEALTLKNIAIGDVFIIAGQSNMEFRLNQAVPGMEKLNDGDYEGIRLIRLPVNEIFMGPQTSFEASWNVYTKELAAMGSAVGYFFARRYRQLKKVTVGLIASYEGGLNIESWLDRDSLLAIPYYHDEVLAYDLACATPQSFELENGNDKLYDGIAKLFPSIPDDHGLEQGFAKPDFDDSMWDTMELPDSWTQAGHNHAGIFWYRKSFKLPAGNHTDNWELHLGMVDKMDNTYLNGSFVGSTGHAAKFDNWNTLRVYTLPQGFVRQGDNCLAVQALSQVSIDTDGGLLGPAEEMYLINKDSGLRISITGPWHYHETHDDGTIGMEFMRTLGYGSSASMHSMFDNHIAPLGELPLSGVVFYQGECNTICTAGNYEKLLTAMIRGWRRCLGNPDLKFSIIQLPNFSNPKYFAPFSQHSRIRDAQRLACKATDSACIVTLGYGDVTEVHPVNKWPVGDAAAEAMAEMLDGMPVQTGPEIVSATVNLPQLILHFEGTEIAPCELLGFAVAGQDGKVFPAKATLLDAHTIALTADQVPCPVNAWYAWSDNPTAYSLMGKNGKKASPFRI